MRRTEKEITDRREIDAVIRRSRVCRLGLSDGGQAHVVPLCFGYDGAAIYLHGASEGRKLEMLRRNGRVCVEFDTIEALVEAEQACGWGIRYQSVLAFGAALFIETPEEKREALKLLMAQYAGSGRSFSFPDAMLDRTTVIKVVVDQITGKRSL